MPLQVLRQLDDVRGDVPRATFLRRLVERELKEREKLQGASGFQPVKHLAALAHATTPTSEGGYSGSHG
jgi:hypothetical protein